MAVCNTSWSKVSDSHAARYYDIQPAKKSLIQSCKYPLMQVRYLKDKLTFC